MIDTLLGGREGITASYLVAGERAGAGRDRRRAPRRRRCAQALAAAGCGAGRPGLDRPHARPPRPLRRHRHHRAAFPRATVVVHRRGARHLAEPGRLVAGSAAVYGRRWSLYGGLDRTAAGRIVAAEDGHRVPLGDGRELVMLETPGHARHHMAVLDEASGTVLAGDAVGARFLGGGLYPTLPPPDVDLAAGVASLDRLPALAPRAPVPRPLRSGPRPARGHRPGPRAARPRRGRGAPRRRRSRGAARGARAGAPVRGDRGRAGGGGRLAPPRLGRGER